MKHIKHDVTNASRHIYHVIKIFGPTIASQLEGRIFPKNFRGSIERVSMFLQVASSAERLEREQKKKTEA